VHEPLRIEFVSRGDCVAGRLWGAGGATLRPLVLVVPALGSSQRAPEVEALCRALAGHGLVAVTLDLPLHGERASAKLSARLLACASRPERSGADARLWAAFLEQTACDLAAAADAAGTRQGVAPRALACVSFEPGAEPAARWAARDPRVESVVRLPREAPAGELVRLVCEGLGGAA